MQMFVHPPSRTLPQLYILDKLNMRPVTGSGMLKPTYHGYLVVGTNTIVHSIAIFAISVTNIHDHWNLNCGLIVL
jgi:hypothetical protein